MAGNNYKGAQEEKSSADEARFFQRLLDTVGEDEREIIKSGTPENIRDLGYQNTGRILAARNDWHASQEEELSKTDSLPEEPVTAPETTAGGVGAGEITGIGAAGLLGGATGVGWVRNRKYRGFKKSAEKYAKEKAKEWEKNPDTTYARSKEGAYNHAINEKHEKFLEEDPKDAQKWAKQHSDKSLQKAIKRKEQLEKPEESRLDDSSGVDLSHHRREIVQGKPSAAKDAPSLPKSSKNPVSPKKIYRKPSRLLKSFVILRSFPSKLFGSSAASSAKIGAYNGLRSASVASSNALGASMSAGSKALAGATKTAGKIISRISSATIKILASIGPAGWAIIALILGFLVFIFFLVLIWISLCNDPVKGTIFKIFGGPCLSFEVKNIPDNPEGVTLSKSGPKEVGNGKAIRYTINLVYDPNRATVSLDDLYLYDLPNYDYELISASGTYDTKTDSQGRDYVEWNLGENSNYTEFDKINFPFTLTVKPLEEDIYAVNISYVAEAYAEDVEVIAIDSGGDGSGGGQGGTGEGPTVQACDTRKKSDPWYGADCRPTSDTCGGKWTTQMYSQAKGTEGEIDDYLNCTSTRAYTCPLIKISDSIVKNRRYNFGDPLCSFSRPKLKTVIERFESNNNRVNFWMDIAEVEGTPNSFGSQFPPKALGPAGHFQMGISPGNVFKKWTPKTTKGDIPWQRQVENAIYWNGILRGVNNEFSFWGAARCLCNYPKYAQMGYCSDIIRRGDTRSPSDCNSKSVELGNRGPQ